MSGETSSLVGQVLGEMYRVTRQIGTGGMGAIYEASHARLPQKRYAVKVLHAQIAGNQEVFQRFRREAEIASALGHDHIVEVHDFNVTPEGMPFMVMEFLDGRDLAGLLQQQGPLPLETVVLIAGQVCSALDAAHQAGIVHRDLKPPNIFLCRRAGRADFVKVLDFGVSKVRDSSSIVTRDHSLMGTPFYMSPEQADGLVHEIDHRTDIFAMGAIVWELLTGRMAFAAPTLSGAIYKVVHVDAPEVHTLRPDVPFAVSAVLRIAMAKQKEHRYASIVDLAEDLVNASRNVAPRLPLPPLAIGTLPPQAGGQVAVALASQPGAALAGTTPLPMMTPPPAYPATQPPPLAPQSTLSAAAGQVAAPPPRSRTGLWVGLGALAVVLAGGGVFLATRGGSDPGGGRQAVGPGGQDPAAVRVDAVPVTPPPPPPPRDPAARVAPDAAPANVVLTFAVNPAGAAAVLSVDGRKVEGLTATLPRGRAEVEIRIDADGFSHYEAKVVPESDRTIQVTLRRKPARPPGGRRQGGDIFEQR